MSNQDSLKSPNDNKSLGNRADFFAFKVVTLGGISILYLELTLCYANLEERKNLIIPLCSSAAFYYGATFSLIALYANIAENIRPKAAAATRDEQLQIRKEAVAKHLQTVFQEQEKYYGKDNDMLLADEHYLEEIATFLQIPIENQAQETDTHPAAEDTSRLHEDSPAVTFSTIPTSSDDPSTNPQHHDETDASLVRLTTYPSKGTPLFCPIIDEGEKSSSSSSDDEADASSRVESQQEMWKGTLQKQYSEKIEKMHQTVMEVLRIRVHQKHLSKMKEITDNEVAERANGENDVVVRMMTARDNLERNMEEFRMDMGRQGRKRKGGREAEDSEAEEKEEEEDNQEEKDEDQEDSNSESGKGLDENDISEAAAAITLPSFVHESQTQAEHPEEGTRYVEEAIAFVRNFSQIQFQREGIILPEQNSSSMEENLLFEDIDLGPPAISVDAREVGDWEALNDGFVDRDWEVSHEVVDDAWEVVEHSEI
ncbi:hypothetical protein B0J14DRAFT_667158 [Halenospora varia]|nr:hypothetical protein B0J14DRAFT_667158 [Halenospora varia]